MEHCITCDALTKEHCRMCGLPVCAACKSFDGVCDNCEEEDDIDAEYRRTTPS